MTWLRRRLTWLMRGVLALGVLVLLFAALGSRPTVETQPTAPVPRPTPLAQAGPTPALAPTSAASVERIVSRIARETQAPFPTATLGPDGVTMVSIVDFGYMPSQVRIRAGQTVAWHNDGRESHDVTGDEDWHSGPIEAPARYRHTFGFPGTFAYRCSVHLDMRGTVVVIP